MDQATPLWTWWLSLLSPFAAVFTRPGWVHVVQWVTSMVLGWEEHTITQLLTAVGLEARWRVLEHFAAYGAWDREAVERHTLRLIAQERPAPWGHYQPVAMDDTKLRRTSKGVWGTCTFHEASARSPHRAETVRAHNWVERGALIPGRPWTYLPHAARMYWRRSQLPTGETFRTKTQSAVELVRQADVESRAPILAVMDGAYAVNTVVGACLERAEGQRCTAIVTRLRADARLDHPVGARQGGKGRPRSGAHGWLPLNIMCTGRSAGSGAGGGSMAGCGRSSTHSSGAAGRSVAHRSRCPSSSWPWRATRSRGFWSPPP